MNKKNELVEEIEKTSKKKTRKKTINNLPTGCDLINLVLGGGYSYGIVNIIGDSSSGKSAFCGEFIAYCNQLLDGELDWFYDDCEKGYRFNSKKLYGIDIINDGFFKKNKRSNTIEDFENNLNVIIEKKEKGKPFIYVLDSFDSLTTKEEITFRKKKLKTDSDDNIEDKKSAGSYNLTKQKENHAIFRTKVRELEENNIILIVISQVKEKIGITFGSKYYRTGGKSLDFYPHIIFWLAEAQKYKKKDLAFGICVKVRGQKTRNDKPFRECYVDFVFDYGIDNISSNLKFLYDLKTKEGKESVKIKKEMEWDGKEYFFGELIEYIEENNLEDELLKRVKEKWDAIEAEISSDNRKRKWAKK